VQLLSSGRTLDAWADALAAEGVQVAGKLEWNPKRPAPKELADARAGGMVRLFVYGMAPVRARVSLALEKQWDSALDFFAA
jgi:hypothetical protein